MSRPRLKTTLLALAGVGVLTSIAYAVQLHVWQHPCSSDPYADLTCSQPANCWCGADWDVAANWLSGVPGVNGIAKINHSNKSVGFCVGGDNDTLPCDDDDDCPGEEGPVFCSLEKELRLAAPTTTIAGLELVTMDSAATTDTLTVAVYPDGTGQQTLTTGSVELDASLGEVTLTVASNARIVTPN